MGKILQPLEPSPEQKAMLDELVDQIHKISEDALMRENQKIEQWITQTIRDKATPQIKGDITLGKLRWRGIKMMKVIDGRDNSDNYVVSQRGKLLGMLKIRCGRTENNSFY